MNSLPDSARLFLHQAVDNVENYAGLMAIVLQLMEEDSDSVREQALGATLTAAADAFFRERAH